ncbi:hypothetical protein B7R76_05885 [Mageeibacillus indolicus]|uniref:NEAT domain-containing protein n=1 Tax=Mageeibacillus indolicus TaxID=884684 RepID=A0A2J8B0S7_9FIRM|nr:hypothetical protein [Mageeibacillus indolicus]PNH18371.1 hypothetical protein B7R76_05885 [Mageeibacillus indolicus]DAR72454.1 MAG TPA: hypothetical protein [Caudoviricetes sp.]
MKRIYRSIAVTVLAALMALPMVVRAEEDNRKIVQEINVRRNPQSGGLVDNPTFTYLGETPKTMRERLNTEFNFETTIGGETYKLEVRSIEFFRTEIIKGNKKISTATRIDKNSETGVYPSKMSLVLAFKEKENHKNFKFTTDPPYTSLKIGGETKVIGRITSIQGEHRYVDGAGFDLDIYPYRKIQFSSVGRKNKFSKVGRNEELEKLMIPIEVSTTHKLSAILKKNGEQNDGALVEYKLNDANHKSVWYNKNANGGFDMIKPEEVDVSSYGLDDKGVPKEDTLDFTLQELNDGELLPYLEAMDVRFKANDKINEKTLIEKAIKVATPDYFGQPDKRDLNEIDVYVGNKKIEEADFEEAKAAAGLPVVYRYKNLAYKAKVFIETAPNPPAPAPQPEPKQQEKTGNTYFDLGRNFLPTCPDSKCAKAGTNAKKDDVPNTAAAANN